MAIQFDDLHVLEADGRTVMHLRSDNVDRDVAELEHLLTHWAKVNRLPKEYEIIPEAHSIHLLERLPALQPNRQRPKG